MQTYEEFLARKTQGGEGSGFSPLWMPDFLFDFQQALTGWAIGQGRGALFADCGMGKTLMQLVWAQNVVQHTNKPVLILTPLAVGAQTVAEAQRFGLTAMRSRDGRHPSAGIVVTNYEKLHLFTPDDFGGVVCDESSILKHFTGSTQVSVTRFLLKVRYRLLCTATAAPNDYVELGCSSEALGEMGMVDMLSRFFKQEPQVSQLARMKKGEERGSSNVVAGTSGGWRLKGHASVPFWRWVASWARACRKPSDLGFPDDAFVLPELIERDHVVIPSRPPDGMLFTPVAVGLKEERDERRRTLDERCRLVAGLVHHDRPAVVWCHLNDEGNLLAKMIPGAKQVKGGDSDDEKESAYASFADGSTRVLVIKPKIGAWGLNWQHCAHVVTFATHSYEQYYQSVRRCWRFGQDRPVVVDIISTEGEKQVRENMTRKARAADAMFTALVQHMRDGLHIARRADHSGSMEVPVWVSQNR